MSGSSHFRAAHAADVLRSCIPYLKPGDRKRAELALSSSDHGKSSMNDVVSSAIEAARSSWSVRESVRRVLRQDTDREIEMIYKTLRPSTAHLLKRLGSSIGGSLDEILSHVDATIALGEEEQKEIQELRTHLAEEMYRTDPKKFASEIKKCEIEKKVINAKLDEWRELGNLMRGSLQDQTLSRLDHITEQWLLYDQPPKLETLTQEIQFVREQKELNPFGEQTQPPPAPP